MLQIKEVKNAGCLFPKVLCFSEAQSRYHKGLRENHREMLPAPQMRIVEGQEHEQSD